MLPFLLAASCAAWHADVVGHYTNQVVSIGAFGAETWIEETAEGLAGHYVIHEDGRDVAGTLAPMGDTPDCATALFRWQDMYGEGWLKLHFFSTQHCFEGYWGQERLDPALTYTSCVRTPATS